MMDLGLVVAVVVGLVAINVVSRLRRRARQKPARKDTIPRFYLRGDGLGVGGHGVGQPVKRFKEKIRLIGKPKREFAGTYGSTRLYRGVDRKHWIRLFPNPGFKIRGKHWCLRKHRKAVRWEA